MNFIIWMVYYLINPYDYVKIYLTKPYHFLIESYGEVYKRVLIKTGYHYETE